jgi:outer membrane protein assembly factor BamB
MKRRILFTAVATSVAIVATLRADNWPQFRGPSAQGISTETGLPLRWDATTNVRWKTALPGPGHSSPVVWGDRIFLTAYRAAGGLRSYFSNAGELVVLALDTRGGKILWERNVGAAQIEGTHSTNAPASPTLVTDGKLVYAYFGSRGLVTYDFEGRQVWIKPFGPFPNEWGSASSPILYNNLLILNVDTDGEDFLLAVDKTNGRTVWRTPRPETTRAWPTAFIWTAAAQGIPNARDQIVVSGSLRVRAYDPYNGREIWTVDGLTMWVAPTPVAAHGLLFVTSNGPGGNIFLAIRPGGRGDVTATHVAWKYDRAAPYIASAVVVGDYIYAVKNGGVVTCLNARTGEPMWQERLRARGDYFSSPLTGDGKIYATSDDGETSIIAARPTFELLATNSVGERVMASPAVADGILYLRSDQHLFAISARR